ncbi:MAG: hypothetical protein ACHQDE_00280 [Acidimicrobiia bacterium]
MPDADPLSGARDENVRNTELLDAELPSPRFVDDAYLRWLYDENPYGPAIQRAADDDGLRVAHYAMVPQRYRESAGAVPAAFSLNAVVRSGTQRQGWFRKLGLEIYEEAAGAGWQFAVGVCNEKSIGAVVKYMGWKTPGPLPVRLCPPARVRTEVESHVVDPAFLGGRDFGRLTTGLDAFPVAHWTNSYTPEYLRWRLACPSASYAIHADADLVAITTRAKRFGVPAAVILKLLPREGRTLPQRGDSIISAACRFHRVPYAVYAGFNAHVAVRGIRPPRRLQPSPLHLILRGLAPDFDHAGLALDTFEFLDMDAY